MGNDCYTLKLCPDNCGSNGKSGSIKIEYGKMVPVPGYGAPSLQGDPVNGYRATGFGGPALGKHSYHAVFDTPYNPDTDILEIQQGKVNENSFGVFAHHFVDAGGPGGEDYGMMVEVWEDNCLVWVGRGGWISKANWLANDAWVLRIVKKTINLPVI